MLYTTQIIEISDQKVEKETTIQPQHWYHGSVWEVDVRVADSTLQWRLESVCSSATTMKPGEADTLTYVRAMVHRFFLAGPVS